ncbi:hypothetical protein DPSP01_000853 [Paraphaeosphaeria sporulosa]
MASRFGDFVTGPKPEPSGNNNITLHFRLRDNAPKHETGTVMYENLDEGILTSTSQLLWQKRGEHIYLVWKESGIVGTYIDWLNDRVLYRPPLDGPTRPSDWTLFKYPKGRMDQYSPLVRDIHTLLNQWLLGWYLQDVTFMDIVMSTLQRLLDEPHEEEHSEGHATPDVFLRFLKPSVINAIWANTAPGAKLRNFIVDYIIKYAPHRQLLYFDGTLGWRQDGSGAAVPQTPKKVPNDFGSFASLSRFSPRRATFSSSSESEARIENSGKPDIYVYPPEFMTELKNVQWGTLLVTQLPEHIRKHYPGQVRVYLPPFPYVLPPAPTRRRFTHYDLEEEPVLQCPRQFVSIIELQGPARELFFETVYGEGKGKTILRSPVWDGGRDLDAANNTVGDVKMEDAFDAPATADKDVPEVKMSCMYHMHTEDRACWLLKNPLVNGGVWPTEDEE